MKNKKIIWALFDDGNGSWQKLNNDPLFNKQVIVYSFGIKNNDWPNYHKVDLRISNFDLEKYFKAFAKTYGKPDFIVASPPCESWSNCDPLTRCFRFSKNIKQTELNMSFFNFSFYEEWNKKILSNNKKHLKRYFFKQIGRMLVGIDTTLATLFLINYFKPKIWIIENPQSSKIWDFIININIFSELPIYKNLTFYNNYNIDLSLKPTYFLSNENFILKKERLITRKTLSYSRIGKMKTTYDQRSAIPHELIQTITLQILQKRKT